MVRNVMLTTCLPREAPQPFTGSTMLYSISFDLVVDAVEGGWNIRHLASWHAGLFVRSTLRITETHCQ